MNRETQGSQLPPSAVETVYFLILSGGAFRGAFQYWVIVHLLVLHTYAAIYGVSVGSVNGIMAAMRKLDTLFEFWDQMTGTRDFLHFRLFYTLAWVLGIIELINWLGGKIVGGFFSLTPLVKKLKANVRLDEVQTPFVAGVVAANSGNYHNFDTRDMKDDQRAVDLVQASSCMVPIMQPPLLNLEEDAEPELGIDGGYRHIFPLPEAEAAKARAEGKRVVIHAIGCTPMERIHWAPSKNLFGPLEMAVRGVDILEAEVYESDVLQLRKVAGEGGEVHLWVPHPLTEEELEEELRELAGTGLTPIDIPGSSFDASRNTIQGRLRESKRMVTRGPIIYPGLGANDA